MSDGQLGSLRDTLPGFFDPSQDVRRAVYTHGLIVPDTNVLLDLYRFRSTARLDLIEALSKVGERLFIPHRVAEEFMYTRNSVIRRRAIETRSFLGAFDSAIDELKSILGKAKEATALDDRDVADLIDDLTKAIRGGKQRLKLYLDDDNAIRPGRPDSEDVVLKSVEELVAGHVGMRPTEAWVAEARRTALERFLYRVPPGFEDADKEPDRALGDYILWKSALEEVGRRKIPLLVVSGDQKADWVRRDGAGRVSGLHPALVTECADVTGQRALWADPALFLREARDYLHVDVSEETIKESQSVGRVQERTIADAIDPGGQGASRDPRRPPNRTLILARRRRNELAGKLAALEADEDASPEASLLTAELDDLEELIDSLSNSRQGTEN